jgi:hypothetical protein
LGAAFFLRAAFFLFGAAFFFAAFFFLATVRPPLNKGLRRNPSHGFQLPKHLPKAIESGSTYNSKTTFRLIGFPSIVVSLVTHSFEWKHTNTVWLPVLT